MTKMGNEVQERVNDKNFVAKVGNHYDIHESYYEHGNIQCKCTFLRNVFFVELTSHAGYGI